MDKSDAQIKAMDALFELFDAIEKGGLSIADLMDVMTMAVEDGWEKMELLLAMVSTAVKMKQEQIVEERKCPKL